MSLIPPSMPGDMERLLWESVPRELQGRVTSLKELPGLFPNFSDRDIVILSTGRNHAVYGVKISRFPTYLAYDCFNCDKIILGPPRINDDVSIRMGMPLAGREGFDAYCANCSIKLYGHTFKMS